MPNFLGWFYFKRLPSGNLFGEFSNDPLKPLRGVESSSLLSKADGTYGGEFDTCWLEGTSPHYAHLKISLINGHDREYILEWQNSVGTIIWEGRGAEVEEMLIGSYAGR